jgi:FlaA1/EpsC-like NDP-sugar epimerase
MRNSRIKKILYERRAWFIVFANIFITSFSYFLALGLRFDFDLYQVDFQDVVIIPLLLLLLFRFLAYAYWQMNRGFWRYVSIYDLISLVKVHVYSSLAFVVSLYFLPLSDYPFSVPFIDFFLSLVIAGGGRFLVRIACEKYLRSENRTGSDGKREAIILGADDSAHLLIKALQENPFSSLIPVAILDDNTRLQGMMLHGVKVLGTLDYLATALRRFPSVSTVICTIPNLSPSSLLILKERCFTLGVSFRSVQSIEDIVISSSLLSLEEESFVVESILEKEDQVPHEDELRNALVGKDVLVTGAGGSIGSELVRQIINFKPNSIVALDNSEYNIFNLKREIADKGLLTNVEFVLASVTDRVRLEIVFDKHQPDIVFHAAAYKHVSITESNPYEAFTNNVLATKYVLDLCHKSKVDRFVLVSSDKAVAPTSVMGASKRIAEYLVKESTDENSASGQSTHCSIVRFGNVINSTGSVIPVFRNQIESGMPITVTHPEMERYFMTTREAVRLMLTAGVLDANGEVYVLDMGKSIKIIEIAEKLRVLYGRKDIPIVFTGMHSGEKLKEVVSHPGEVLEKTSFDKVLIARINSKGKREVPVSKWVDDILKKLPEMPESMLANILLAYANDVNISLSCLNKDSEPGLLR